jgi:cellulose synthase/poly-beta-1,6-N-acetylglucosamine synthase-like glycosyltransferase
MALSLLLLGYVYAGYPALLRLVVALRGARRVARQPATPRLTLVISAYNEAAVIRQKLENAVALDYPREALEIVVISDASTDATDAIVSEFVDRGVVLHRQPERLGKTAGLNRVVPMLSGEIIVFSDANAMYNPDALRKITRNFADPRVGCVTGEARYLPGGGAAADLGERAYWDYEMQIKRLETALGSMVGGDGAIYAIRRSLWRELPENAINDFLNPLQIVAAGWRGVYEPEAVCHEETAGGSRTEYRRRVRIVSRSWRAVFQVPAVLNPFRVGLFAWSVFSHKVLRWLSGAFAILGAIGATALALDVAALWPMSVPLAVAAGAAALAFRRGRRLAALLGYFAIINIASLVGVFKGSLGQVSGVWTTPRQSDRAVPSPARLAPVGLVFLALSVIIVFAAITALMVAQSDRPAVFVFWMSSAILVYVFLGYPLVLAAVRIYARRPIERAHHTPSVCLFIAANDEESVIEAKLRNALALDYPADRLDIVVASDGSVDRTNAIVQGFAPRVRLLELSPRRGKIAAINEGMRRVDADIVVFSDANTFLDRSAMRALVANFADPQVGAVSGDVVLIGERAALGRSEDLYYLYERWLQQAESEIGSMIGVDGALYAIRRRLFVPPAADTILDDMAIPMAVVRFGYRIVFEPLARAQEQGSDTAKEEFARKSRVVAGAVQFLTRGDSALPVRWPQVMVSLVSHKGLRWLTPAFAALAFLASVTLAGSSRLYAIAALVQIAVLMVGVAGCVPLLRRASPVALAHYFFLVQAAAAVGFLRGLAGRQSVLWRRFSRVPAGHSAA